jgi:ATP-dependent DNA helicase DinG
VLSETLQSMSTDRQRSIKIRFRRNDNLHRTVCRELQGLMLQWSEFSASFSSIASDLTQIRGEGRLAPELLFELRSTVDSLEELLENLKLILDASDDNRVFWVEAGSGKTTPWCTLYAAPVSIAEMMNSEFWQKCDSVILTSATLTTGGDFRHIKGSLGLDYVQPERVSELILGSPFKIEEQMRVIAPLFLPDPKQQQEHVNAVAELSAVLVENVHRGTLILCTSLEAVRQISTFLEPVARRAGRVLLSQRSAGAPHELLRQFRKHHDAILVGAASFWEGIDVIGDSVQILIIAKLPFDVPTEPWVEARSEHLRNQGRDAFNEFSIPAATLRLKQGLGRLIRHQDDRGVAILCDPRLLTSRFGQQIRSSLPTKISPAQTMSELSEQIQDFFHTVAS